MVIGDLVAKFNLDSTGFTAGMKNVQSMTKSATSRVKLAVPVVKQYTSAILKVGTVAAISTIAIAKLIASVEAIDRKLAASVGNSEDVTRAWSFLRDTSRRLGVGLQDLAGNYGSLAAAAKGSALSTTNLENIFTALSEKAAILGMSSDRVRLTFLAIEQMVSKSVISMEELRRQFGENVPGALGIMARSLGINVKELNKWVTSGKLLAEDVLPLMANQMIKENIPALEDLRDSTQVALGSINTAWFELKKTIADGLVKDAILEILGVMRFGIDTVTSFASAVNSLWSGFKSFTTWLAEQGGTLSSLGIDPKQLNTTVAQVQDANKTILMSAQEIAKKQLEIREAVVGESAKRLKEWKSLIIDTTSDVVHEFTSFVSDLATGADASFSAMLNSMAKKLVDFTTTILVVKPIMEWLGSWLDGLSGSAGSAGGLSSFLLKAIGIKKFAAGGIINEPVLGIGATTGGRYLIGENGPETVTPTGTGSSKGGGVNNFNITINALDSKSVTDLLRENPQAVTAPLIEALTSGDRGLASSLRMAVN